MVSERHECRKTAKNPVFRRGCDTHIVCVSHDCDLWRSNASDGAGRRRLEDSNGEVVEP